ncbi:MAG: hypothetical protein GQ527_11835, partial [Bacteroidales bacterium]|nr:hypothetical protein [Bacteroidales bacterium]
LNGKGLIIAEGDPQWIPIISQTPSEIAYYFNTKFSKEGIQHAIQVHYTEYDAVTMRKQITDASVNLEEIFITDITVEEDGIEMIGLDQIEDTLIIKINYFEEEEQDQDKIYFIPFLNETLGENPLKEKTRKYPIDMAYPKKRKYVSTISIPEGYKLDYYLKDFKNIDNTFFKLDYICQETEDELIIAFSYYFKKSIYPSNGYGRLKFYFDKIIKLDQQKVVFIKE